MYAFFAISLLQLIIGKLLYCCAQTRKTGRRQQGKSWGRGLKNLYREMCCVSSGFSTASQIRNTYYMQVLKKRGDTSPLPSCVYYQVRAEDTNILI